MCSSDLQIRRRFDNVELYGLQASPGGCFVKVAAGHIETRDLRGATRYDDGAIIGLAEAFKPRAGVHRIADGRDDLRSRRPHRTDDGFALMNADADPERHGQIVA